MTLADSDMVECHIHGTEGAAYVCQHLNLTEAVGFIEGYDPADPEAELYQAWCRACDAVLMREGDWNDRSEAFAGVRMVCRGCYKEMRALNRQASE
jgi:hypothetical protein